MKKQTLGDPITLRLQLPYTSYKEFRPFFGHFLFIWGIKNGEFLVVGALGKVNQSRGLGLYSVSYTYIIQCFLVLVDTRI